MAINIIYPVVYVPQEALTYSFRQKLPIRINCATNQPPFLLNEGDSWNCNLCGADKPFFIPFLIGDIIPLQTQYPDNYNTDPAIINFGFKDTLAADWYVEVELQDANGATISSFIDVFCTDYWVSHSADVGSLQTWFINTALLPSFLECFRLKITYYFFNQITALKEVERVIYTEYYQKVKDCERYSVITSDYDTSDCYGGIYTSPLNYLGTSNIAYYNFIRLEGENERQGNEENIEVETDRGVILRRQIIENWNFKGGIIAPFFADMIERTLRGKNVYVNFKKFSNFSFAKNNDASREWVVNITMQNDECKIDSRNCNL